MRIRRAGRCAGGLAACVAVLVAAAAAAAPSDDYVRGYADALLSNVLGLHAYTLDVDDGTLRLSLREDPRDVEQDALVRALLAIEGVERVEVRTADGEVVRETRAPEPTPEPARTWELFPSGELFEPLLADPRWPHFSATHQWYLGDEELGRVGAVSFGETFALLRSPETGHGRLELGFQAGVFSVFDLEAESMDLVNSDFMVGLTLTHRLDDLATLLRVYHQSSHLGDEFLLRNRIDRVNLSYEALDVLVSYDLPSWLRVYGGGGLLLHREPELDRWLAEVGFELESPQAYLAGHLRPVGALDVQLRQESDWHGDLSARLGLQIESRRLRRLRMQILGEYYRGRSPNGQFYDRRIETIGVGAHLGF